MGQHLTQFVFWELGFGQYRDKLGRRHLGGCMINANLLAKDEMTSEVSSRIGYHISQRCHPPTGSTCLELSQNHRSRVQS
jgi:hypothetical protein